MRLAGTVQHYAWGSPTAIPELLGVAPDGRPWAELWIGEWERLYDRIRSLSKPVVAALNGVAAGSAFQVALLWEVQPNVYKPAGERNRGIAKLYRRHRNWHVITLVSALQ